MVHEARGDSRQAADCYRKVIAFRGTSTAAARARWVGRVIAHSADAAIEAAAVEFKTDIRKLIA
jgi:hypothetical protein